MARTHRKLLAFRAECVSEPLPIAASWKRVTFDLVTCTHSRKERRNIAALCGQETLSH